MAAAMLLPLGMIAGSSAGAAGGTVCASAAGTAVFAPPLPIIGNKATVKGTLTATGTLGKCVGGGVTSAHTLFKTPKATTGANCTTLLTFVAGAKPTTGTETITWNTGKKSTVALQLHQVKGKATQTSVTGTVTAGLFKGSKQTGTLTYKAVPATGCAKTPLAKVSYTQVTKATIK